MLNPSRLVNRGLPACRRSYSLGRRNISTGFLRSERDEVDILVSPEMRMEVYTHKEIFHEGGWNEDLSESIIKAERHLPNLSIEYLQQATIQHLKEKDMMEPFKLE